MDVLEFLRKTDIRNIKHRVGCLVERKMKDFEETLQKRKQRLKILLNEENLRLEEELSALYERLALENEKKRADWLLQRQQDETKAADELKKLKKIQQERENCESLRELKSKEILLETKEAQKYQIKENAERRKRLRELELKWFQVQQRLLEEKTKQDAFEALLQKQIAKETEQRNLRKQDEIKLKQKQETEIFNKQMAEENQKAAELEKQCREQELRQEKQKKFTQALSLKDQITQHKSLIEHQKVSQMQQAKALIEAEKLRLAEEQQSKVKAKLENRLYHADYLAYALEEKQQKAQQAKDFEALLSTKCTLLQQNKKPYGKTKR